MMKEMSAPPYGGNTDKDFVAHMIPHHQGAIDGESGTEVRQRPRHASERLEQYFDQECR